MLPVRGGRRRAASRPRGGRRARQQLSRYAMYGLDLDDDDDDNGDQDDILTMIEAGLSTTTTTTTTKAPVIEGLEDAADEGEEEQSEVWKQYQCKSIAFGKKHPGSLVEGAALAAIDLPKNTYPLQDSLQYQIDNGLLSSMQLEGVMYACERHSRKLPDGQRAGFLLNDSAGVGKGRQASGIIVDNLLRGRPRHVWFSVSKDLHLDASRDLRDLCCSVQIVESVAKLATVKTDPQGCVVFCTYTELISKGKQNTKDTRYDELVKWLCGGCTKQHREAFDGCLIFDESHKAKNVIEGKADSAAVSSKTGELVVKIQNELPNARVVYSSATGISGIESMGYLTRMGLWGENTAFRTFGEFWQCFGGSRGNAGFGSLEMMALNFKASGCSVARSVGYYGATFDTVNAPLSKDIALMYRNAVVWMRDLLEALHTCRELCSRTPNGDYRASLPLVHGASSRLMSMYWGSHLRFMRQLISGLKVPILVQTAKEALRDGHCVVIGLQTTNEAYLKQYQEDGDGLEEFPEVLSSCKLIMRQFINKWFPVKQTWQRAAGDPDSLMYRISSFDLTRELSLICKHVDHLDSQMFIKKVYSYVYETPVNVPSYSADGTVMDCVVMRFNLLERLNNLPLPSSALDDLMDQLGGPNKVAEMTGRSVRQVRCEDTGMVRIKRRFKDSSQENSLNVQEQRAFQQGHKLIAIISEAASTGISLHADKSKKNQRRRVHCTLELPWQAQQAIQQLGRSHRTNQLTAPMFKLVSSGLGGEHRFLSSISKRLQSLGALTQGNRKASLGSLSFGEFQYESEHGRRALKHLYNSIAIREFPQTVSFKRLIEQSREQVCLDSSPQLNSSEKWCTPPARGVSEIKTPEEFFDLMQEPLCIIGGYELDDAGETEIAQRNRWKRDAALLAAKAKAKNKASKPIVLDGAGEEEEEEDVGPCTIESKAGKILRFKEGKKQNGTLHDIPRFFNRILGLPLCQQSLIFNYFSLLLEADIKDAKQKGRFDRGLQTLEATLITRLNPEEMIYRNPATGDKLVLHTLLKDRGVPVSAAFREVHYRLALLNGNPTAKRTDFPLSETLPTDAELQTLLASAGGNMEIGFFRSREAFFGRHRVCLAIKISSYMYAVIRPATGVASSSQMEADALQRKYRAMQTVDEISRRWTEEYELEECFHGPNCKKGSACGVGRRKQEITILGGNVISFWMDLQQLARISTQNELSIVQTNVTETDERIVGVLVEFPVQQLKTRVNQWRDQDDVEKRAIKLNLPVKPCRSTMLPGENPMVFNSYLYGIITSGDEQEEMFGFRWQSTNTGYSSKHIVTFSSLPEVKVGYELKEVSGRSLQYSTIMRHMFSNASFGGAANAVQQHSFVFLRPRTAQDDLDDDSVENVGLKMEGAAPVVDALVKKLIVPKQEEEEEEGDEIVDAEEEEHPRTRPRTAADEVVYIDSTEDEEYKPPVAAKKRLAAATNKKRLAAATTKKPLASATTTTTATTMAAPVEGEEEVICVLDSSDNDTPEPLPPCKRQPMKATATPPAAIRGSSRNTVKRSYTSFFNNDLDNEDGFVKDDDDEEEEDFEDKVFDEEEADEEFTAKRSRIGAEEDEL